MATAAPMPAPSPRKDLTLSSIQRFPTQIVSTRYPSPLTHQVAQGHSGGPRSRDAATASRRSYDVVSLNSRESYDDEDLPPAPAFIPPPPPPPPPPLAAHFPSRLPLRLEDAYRSLPRHPAPPLPFDESNAQAPLPWHPTAMVTSLHAPISQFMATSSLASSPEVDYSEDELSSSAYYNHRHQAQQSTMETRLHVIWRLRSEQRQKRTELYRFLSVASDLDSLSAELPQLDLSRTLSTEELHMRFLQFHHLLGSLQNQRNEYLRAYHALEVDLDRTENEIVEEEARLLGLQTAAAEDSLQVSVYGAFGKVEDGWNEDRELHHSVATMAAMNPQSELLLGISEDRYEDIHPLYTDLMDAVGERELAREFEEELKMHREKILSDLEINLHRKRVQEHPGESISEERLNSLKTSLDNIPTDRGEFKARFGVDIHIEELEFLRDFDCDIKRARRNLEKQSRAVDRLRDLCEAKGVMKKHPSYNDELTILLGSDNTLAPGDGNMSIHGDDSPPHNGARALLHPRFPILLSNPSHVLDLLSPQVALERALALPRDSPESAQRRAECMKELGIAILMKNVESKPDYINQWLIHRLRTSPLEAEQMLAVFETNSKVMNLRRWQEEVLFHWRLDEAAKISPLKFEGPRTPVDEPEFGEHEGSRLNSDITSSM